MVLVGELQANELRHVSAAELGRMIDAGRLDPVDLASLFLNAIEAHDDGQSVYARLTNERALKEASEARDRARRGMRRGPLDGVPVSWKDLFDSAGIATEAGSRLLAGRVPQEDCTVLRRATDAGTVCLGKTHMSELAFSGLGVNPMTGTPPNIHDKDLAPGGSSSGAGASVALGLAPIGVGSDTGGSVRIPAAWNDLVGLKTTHGLVPTEGVVPLCTGFDTIGPLARSVEDAARMHEILSGQKVDLDVDERMSDCRFFVCEDHMFDQIGDDQLRGFEDAVKRIEKAGAQVERGTIPEYAEFLEIGPKLFPFEAWSKWGEIISEKPDLMFEPVRNRFLAGKAVNRKDYFVAWERMMKLRRKFEFRTGSYDAILAPTVAIAPPKVSDLMADMDYFWDQNLLALRNTRFGNMTGSAALTLPTGVAASGLMLIGHPMSEIHLLRMGKAIERLN